MDGYRLALYWDDIPVGRENAASYDDLERWWSMDKRSVRMTLHKLSSFDSGDDYILIRSAKTKGFYKSENPEEIKAYRQECLNKGRSMFAPVRKINRVLGADSGQFQLDNNLRVIRELKSLKQEDVVAKLQAYDTAIDKSMLSKMENGVCLPTPYQLSAMAKIYGCSPRDLVDVDFYF